MIQFLSRAFGGGDKKDTPQGKKRVNLALQGGGAHGAFTWGVLDHLLEDGRLSVEGISGTSAGAVNAVMLADGLKRGGPDEARKRLADFWRAASVGGDLPPLQRAVTDRLFSLLPNQDSPTFDWLNAWSKYLSPYDVNPLNINPLKDLIERFVDFEGLRADPRVIFIAATNVQTGRLHIFPREQDLRRGGDGIGLPAGGVSRGRDRRRLLLGRRLSRQSGALSLLPHHQHRRRADRADQSAGAQESPDLDARDRRPRATKSRFNSSLLGELRAIEFVNRLIEQKPRAARHRTRTNTGRSRCTASCSRVSASGFSSATKLRNDYESFELLRKLGQRSARRFLDAHYDDVGVRSSIDLKAEVYSEWDPCRAQ